MKIEDKKYLELFLFNLFLFIINKKMSIEYSSPNGNLILKKKNPFLGEQLTQFPQYKSAVPNPPKLKNDMSHILSYEGYDKKKFKGNISFKATARQSVINSAINMGYLFVPGIKFKTIDGDSVILSQNIPSSNTVSQFLQSTKSSTNGLDKTIAIYYTGSGSTSRRCYYKRQFWLEDIVPIDAQTQSNIPDSGIFFRNLGDVYSIISSPEDISKYSWINNGDGTSDNNKNINFKVNDYNIFNNVYFLMCFNNYTVFNFLNTNISNTDFIANLQLNGPNKLDTDIDTINKSQLFRLTKINKDKNNNLFYIEFLDTKNNNQWTKTSLQDLSSNTPVLRTVKDSSNVEFQFPLVYDSSNNVFHFDPSLTTNWGGPSRRVTDHDYRITNRNFGVLLEDFKNKIIHPNYNYIYKKIFSDPQYGAQPYICIYGTSTNDPDMVQFSKDNSLYPPQSIDGSFTDQCENILSTYCTYTVDGINYPNLFSDECSISCKNSLTGMCDDAISNWCANNKPADTVDVNSDTYTAYLKKCGCFMPGNYYNNLDNSYSSRGFSLPNCVKKFKYTICGNADYKDQASQIAAADSCNVDIMNCVQSVNIDNKGNISGDINVSQGASCQQLRKIVTPSSTGTNIVNTPTTGTASTTTDSGSASGGSGTTGDGTTSTTPTFPNIASENVSNKILGLEPMVFYGIIGAVVFLLIILIIFLMMRKGNTQTQSQPQA